MKFVDKFKLELSLSWQALVASGHDILLGLMCDRTTSNMRGFVSQDHIGGFSTERECANTHK
jgi:hypothetical protein